MRQQYNLAQWVIFSLSLLCAAFAFYCAVQINTQYQLKQGYGYTLTRQSNGIFHGYSAKALEQIEQRLASADFVNDFKLVDFSQNTVSLDNWYQVKANAAIVPSQLLLASGAKYISRRDESDQAFELGGIERIFISEAFWQSMMQGKPLAQLPTLSFLGRDFVVGGIVKTPTVLGQVDLLLAEQARDILFNSNKPEHIRSTFSYAVPNRKAVLLSANKLSGQDKEALVAMLNQVPSSSGIYEIGESRIRLDFGIDNFNSQVFDGIVLNPVGYTKQQQAISYTLFIGGCFLLLSLIAFIFWEVNRQVLMRSEIYIKTVYGAGFIDLTLEDASDGGRKLLIPAVIALLVSIPLFGWVQQLSPFDTLLVDGSLLGFLLFLAISFLAHFVLMVTLSAGIRYLLFANGDLALEQRNLGFVNVTICGVCSLLLISAFLASYVFGIGNQLLKDRLRYEQSALVAIKVKPSKDMQSQANYERHGIDAIAQLSDGGEVGMSRLAIGEPAWNKATVSVAHRALSNVVVNEVNQGFFRVFGLTPPPTELQSAQAVVSETFCQVMNVSCEALIGQSIAVGDNQVSVVGHVTDLAYEHFLSPHVPTVYIYHRQSLLNQASFVLYAKMTSPDLTELRQQVKDIYPFAQVQLQTLEGAFDEQTKTLNNIVWAMTLFCAMSLLAGGIIFYFFLKDSVELTANEIFILRVHGAGARDLFYNMLRQMFLPLSIAGLIAYVILEHVKEQVVLALDSTTQIDLLAHWPAWLVVAALIVLLIALLAKATHRTPLEEPSLL